MMTTSVTRLENTNTYVSLLQHNGQLIMMEKVNHRMLQRPKDVKDLLK